MLYNLFSFLVVFIVLGCLLVGTSIFCEKITRWVIKHISDSTALKELFIWLFIYTLGSVAVFIIELYVFAIVWEAIF